MEPVFESIVQALRDGSRVEIRRFGSFATRRRDGRVARNPKTGAQVVVGPKKIAFFKPGKELLEVVQRALQFWPITESPT